MLPLDDEAADRLLDAIPPDARRECWWLVLGDGTPVPGDRGGGVALLSHLRLTRPLGRVLSVTRAAGLVDAGDRLLARHRGRLGRLVPEGPAPRRYP